jgi:hypothetical protein
VFSFFYLAMHTVNSPGAFGLGHGHGVCEDWAGQAWHEHLDLVFRNEVRVCTTGT